MSSKKEIQINSIIAQVDRNSLQVEVNTLQLQPQKQQKQDQKRKLQQGISNIFYYVCSCFQSNENDPSPQLEMLQKKAILPPQKKEKLNRKTLVIDLDETLVHSSFTPPENPDIIIPVEIEGATYSVFVLKRPGLDIFLQQMSQIYEIVVFTASLSKYGHPLLDELDKNKLIDQRLFREACVAYEGQYVKDLRLLGRDLSKVIIIDVSFLKLQNSPISYLFQPENAIPVKS